MATEDTGDQNGLRARRACLIALGLWPVVVLGKPTTRAAKGLVQTLAAAWQKGDQHQVGLLDMWQDAQGSMAMRVRAALDVPTRAHGLWLDARGCLVVVARRPGDWMLRWAPGQPPQWHWMDGSSGLNGHVTGSPDGRWLITTQTDLDSGAGMLGVRDAQSLKLLQAWPTLGRDPHQLLWDRHVAGHLMVANGGIATRPETGRVKHDMANMDSSLVRLDPASGRVQGQWRLGDARLSMRHLAWHGRHLGIALQAEHDEPGLRANAPVLAVLDGEKLMAHAPHGSPQGALQGYGGDIAATDEGFAVSCPKAGGVARFGLMGEALGFTPLPKACALARDERNGLWQGGHPAAALNLDASALVEACLSEGLQLDNHWIALPGATRSGVQALPWARNNTAG